MAHRISKKKWLILGAVGTALLLIPRRSSRQTGNSRQSDSHPQSEIKKQNAS
ncbi:MAG: hypothetical protein N2B04_00055 [Psychrobacter sp.]